MRFFNNVKSSFIRQGGKFYTFLIPIVFFTNALQATQPERIISLASSLTKNIYFLDAQDKLVGCTSFCEEAKRENKEVVATAVMVNLEKVVNLKPDLIIATALTNPETIDLLQQFGIKVEIFVSPTSFEGICSQFERLGKLVGKHEQAQKIIGDSKKKVNSLSKSIVDGSERSIFFQIGAKPLFTVIPNTFMNDYMLLLKMNNIATDLNKGTITREAVIARNPDIIFIVTMGIVGDEEKEIWRGFKEINAVKNNKIFVVDSDLACTPTPISFVKTLETMVELIKE